LSANLNKKNVFDVGSRAQAHEFGIEGLGTRLDYIL
jgi:hypothetical protein